jgi:genome maintenance exonuclease 1
MKNKKPERVTLTDVRAFSHSELTWREVDTRDMEYGRGYVVSEDEVYPSITTILGSTADKSGLDAWRAAVGEEEAARVSKRATDKGTAVHEMCELYLKNSLVDVTGYGLVERESFLRLKPVIDAHVTDVYAQETPLYSKRQRMAGRVDLIAKWDGVLSIIDFKTSNRPKVRGWITDYFIQETAYAMMLYEMTGTAVHQVVTLITVEDDDPQVFIEKPRDWFNEVIARRRKFRELRQV